ncbi:MAG: SDR family NAD(P)-dependent oxidoreductase [Thiobacillaceae bacterium]
MKKRKRETPVAIVGMAFRLPGDQGDEQSLWQALREGRNLVSCVGPERWSTDLLQHPRRSEPGRSVTFSAGVLSRIDEFDAGFFGISPREAAWLDPQQRLLLELAWEAMENGGLAPSRLSGSDCAVYVGISGVDYGMRSMDDLAGMTAHSMTGNTFSLAANRLSYVFDLHGPSVAVDTACSSSLVALHHACNALRSGESSLAMVGGVNLLLHPYPFIGFTKASMLSANGQCRAFDASGDGYVRAEGGAVLLLKPLDKALSDGDDIHAVIRATGANADGSRKTGITIPSSEGQAELMRAVLQRSGLSVVDIDYIEAHGTGTAVGDPIETAAIGEVYGRPRPHDRPLPIGSVKTNLGHLEAASGMAGLVKAILVLKNRALPPSLHMETPNPRIDFSGLNLDVVTGYRLLQKAGRNNLVVGVNSFGFGGANAHVLLEEFRPPRRSGRQVEPANPPLFLSARAPQALRDLAGRYAALLRQESGAYYDIAFGAAMRRERLEKRLALPAANAIEMADQLTVFAQGGTVPQLVLEDALGDSAAIAFVYSGNGAQWLGMGRRLLAESPRFAELMAGLDASIGDLAGFSLLNELQADATASHLDDAAVSQSLLFAMQVALTTLLREQGVEAHAVAGHSVGEVAAAWAAGALSLDQAVEVIVARSTAQALTRGSGRMAAIALSAEAAAELLAAEHLDTVEIAGINSPDNVTLSGSFADLERLNRILTPRAVFFRHLDLDYAFHSRSMDPIKDNVLKRLSALAPVSAAAAPVFVSTVTGGVLDGSLLDAGYWWRNVRQPVRFAQAMSTLAAQGCRVFLEIGPHAILQRYISECLVAQGITGRVLPTLLRDNDGLARLEMATLTVHLLTEPSRPGAFFPEPGRHVRLPNYPWQRERHWHSRTSEDYRLIERRRVHPLLGWRLKEVAAAWENVLDLVTYPWLADHKVSGAVVLPGAAYVEMALAAAREHFGGTGYELEELDILAPIVLDGEHARSLRFELSMRDGSFQIRSRQRLSEDEWTLNAVGRLLGAPAVAEPAGVIQNAGDGGEAIVIDRDTHYRLAGTLGLEYGPCFQGLERVEVQGQSLLATLSLPASITEAAAQYLLHPAVLDVCFQSLVDFFRDEIEAGQGLPLLPVKVGALRFYATTPVVGFRTALKRRSARSVLADFELLDASGRIVAVLAGCRFRAATLQRRGHAEPACWKIVPLLKPLEAEQSQSRLPATLDLSKQLRKWFVAAEAELHRDAYFRSALPLFEALTVSFARDSFQELFERRGDWLSQALKQPEIVGADVRPYFVWLASLLKQERILVEDSAGTWTLESDDLPPARNIWRTLLREHPGNMPELVFAARIGRRLAQLLTGETDAHALVEGLRRSHQAETLFDDSPAYLGSRLAVEQILRIVATDWPTDRRLRVLEVCAGAGTVARQLAEVFPKDRLDFVIAHADDEALDRLQAEYASDPSATVAKLEGEGLELADATNLPEHYDVILLRHWLHRAPHPAAALTAVRRKLARGGLLLLAERQPDLAADFLAGPDPQWWRESAEGAPLSRYLSPKSWEQALLEQGYVEVETCLEPASAELAEGAYLLLAKRPHQDLLLPSAEPAMAGWLLICAAVGPSRTLADRLRCLLESLGQRVVTALAGATEQGELTFLPADPASAEGMLAAARDTLGKVEHIVYLSGLGDDAAKLNRAQSLSGNDPVVGVLHLVQAISHGAAQPRLWLVTTGGALADELPGHQAGNPLQGALWGFGRVIMNEYPAISCTLIDLDIDLAAGEAAQRLQAELLAADGEREIVLSAGGRFVLRMERATLAEKEAIDEPPARFRLDFRVPGQLRNLVWLPQPERPLAEGEVEVRVAAAGLNFRDVMYLMGLLPDEAVEDGFAGASLGLELAGIVTRVGGRAGEFSVGDAVMGFGSACFASHVVTQANALTHKPADWSFAAAATVPTVFFTVYYALKHLANMQPGERVLIHGAAGGVGIAAVQLALHLGAEVFATAGSEEKRDFVRLLGADHVLDSRNLSFADEILALTGGEGVDVVLNSLAGEAIRRNLRALKPFGRFLELGKRDFFENTPIGLRPFKDNISYFGIDADQLLIARPTLAAQLFREVMALFRDGVLFPLPYREFPADRVVDAFRTMQQARQIGKVVVKLDGAMVPVETTQSAVPPVRFGRNSTWLVTGGLAGFGLESARWLAERGAGHFVLAGRRGNKTPGAAEAVRELEAMGARVKVCACDIADRSAVQSMLEKIHHELPPLTGILHAAMVLDDTVIANLDAERMRKVLAPKLLGAWNLHSLTQNVPLEHFILYSSITTFIGNPGQANYVAANASLEALAALRRVMGLPATCIGWGPIGDVGYLSRNQAVKDSLASRLGAEPLTARDALAMLDRLLPRNGGAIAVADFDWPTLARLLPSAQENRFAVLRRQGGTVTVAGSDGEDIRALIAGKTEKEVQEMVQALVTQEVAQILCIGPDRIDPARSLHDLGMDSLMGVELGLGLEKRFGIQLPAMMLGEGPTVERVAARIIERVLGTDDQGGEDAETRHETVVTTLAMQHGEEIPADELVRMAKQTAAGARLIP